MPFLYLGVAGVVFASGYFSAQGVNKTAWQIVAVLALIIWFKKG
ncbi:hypothetical protein [Vibrio methylphosphonaticus]|nr:hypothetical protein [Vibrio methylphosphonaticus]